jgi:signal transduction histidine kinase
MMTNSTDETILIIDDNPTNLEVLADALDHAGYKVLVEMNGHSGLERIQRNPPDLILLDIMMPGINGLEVCRQLRSYPDTCEIPVIFMTALSDTEHKVQGLNLGAVDYITKPFQQEEVLARIKIHLKLRRLNLELAQQKQLLEDRVQERTAALSQALTDLQTAQVQLVQSEKMSSMGQLVAGVAHEINNPLGFIAGNLNPAQEYIQDLFRLIDLYQENYPNPAVAIQEEIAAIDLEYLKEDLLKLVVSMREGVNRMLAISTSLRTFSRADSDRIQSFNIHEGLDSTILILKHRLKANESRPAIEVITDYGELPLLKCFPGQLNQVFMNLLANAIDALEESNQERTFEELKAQPNQIIIKTELSENQRTVIRIQDNGKGMSEKTRAKIFDHLFTTKEVGKGTGLGLAIAHQIIVDKHGGTITAESELGKGTTFVISLPQMLQTQQVSMGRPLVSLSSPATS